MSQCENDVLRIIALLVLSSNPIFFYLIPKYTFLSMNEQNLSRNHADKSVESPYPSMNRFSTLIWGFVKKTKDDESQCSKDGRRYNGQVIIDTAEDSSQQWRNGIAKGVHGLGDSHDQTLFPV